MLKINLIRVKYKCGVSQGSKTLEKQECCLSLIVRKGELFLPDTEAMTFEIFVGKNNIFFDFPY